LPKFLTLVDQVTCIGEIGLDFSASGKPTSTLQRQTLRAILQRVGPRPRFLSLHSRGAESAILDLLQEFQVSPVVFHWYSGPFDSLDRIARDGHYFSVNTAMVQSKNALRRIERMPPDRVLTETDGPYVKINGEPARPVHVRQVVRGLGRLWELSDEEAARRVAENLFTLVAPIRESPANQTRPEEK
jgi:TatD DNase family protein